MKKLLLLAVTVILFFIFSAPVFCKVPKIYNGMSEKELTSLFSHTGINLVFDRRSKNNDLVGYHFKLGGKKVLVFLSKKNKTGRYLYLNLMALFKTNGVNYYTINSWNKDRHLTKIVKIDDNTFSIEEDFITLGITEDFIKTNVALFLVSLDNLVSYFY